MILTIFGITSYIIKMKPFISNVLTELEKQQKYPFKYRSEHYKHLSKPEYFIYQQDPKLLSYMIRTNYLNLLKMFPRKIMILYFTLNSIDYYAKICELYSEKKVKKYDLLKDFIKYEYLDFIEYDKAFLNDTYCYKKFRIVIKNIALNF